MTLPSVTVKSAMTDNMEAVKNRERNRELDNLAADVRAKIQAANTTTSRPSNPDPAMDAEITRKERQVSLGYDNGNVQVRNVEEDMYISGQNNKDFANDPYYLTDKGDMGVLTPRTSGKGFDLPDKFEDEGDRMGD